MFTEIMENKRKCLDGFIEAESQRMMDKMVDEQQAKIRTLRRKYHSKTSLIKTPSPILMWYIKHQNRWRGSYLDYEVDWSRLIWTTSNKKCYL